MALITRLAGCVVCLAPLLTGCVESKEITQGESLARRHCGGCHQFPDPSLLDKRVWSQNVLPRMALRLGLKEATDTSGALRSAYFGLIGAQLFPAQPALSPKEWQLLVNYYAARAPEQLSVRPAVRLPPATLFNPRQPATKGWAMPAVTCVKFDSVAHRFYVADNQRRRLMAVDRYLNITSEVPLSGLVSQVQWVDDTTARAMLLTYLGSTPNPTEDRAGYLTITGQSADGATQERLSRLARPTQVLAADLDHDGQAELISSEFGYLTGKLAHWKRQADGTYGEHPLKVAPGALQVAAQDLTGDGRVDIVALFAQGDEGISLFENRGNGTFHERRLLQFPPSYGSSSFELKDMNGDGRPDILYTCGDNADDSKILKPYHGVYIFSNEGNNQYRRAFFFPLNGAYRAKAADFDGDGDPDIAAISFFADYACGPEESFVYLENRGKFGFDPFALGITQLGRWITLDAGDVDEDGDVDVMLGNCSVADGFMHRYDEHWQKGPAFVLLENTTRPARYSQIKPPAPRH